ncbi:MAG: lysophospholipid acyltransferase family protein [Bryobacteraceae bacterium]
MNKLSPGLVRSVLITAPLIILATIVYGSVSLLVSLFDKSGDRQLIVARAWARMLLRIGGVRTVIEGLEKIDPRGSYVFASNHASYMDTPVVLGLIPVQFRFLAKEDLFRIPFLGTHLRSAGHIPVPKQDARAAVRLMNESARIIRERGISMLVFPEGGRTDDGNLQRFREGAANIAIKAGVPIVPITLEGTRSVLPMHSVHVRSGRVRLKISDPIPTAGLTLHDREALTDQVRLKIVELLG